jgi:hypothetical protein
VFIATNDSLDTIKTAVSDDEFREACRKTLSDPKWFRADMKTVPDDYEYQFEYRRTALYLSGL